MSLAQLSAIAQILAAGVGIPSLIFVGIQLNLATKAVRASSSQAHAAMYHALSGSIVDNSTGFASIWRQGLTGSGGLSEEERVRFFAFISSLLRFSSPLEFNGVESNSIENIGVRSSNRLNTFPASLGFKSFGVSASIGIAWNSNGGSAH